MHDKIERIPNRNVCTVNTSSIDAPTEQICRLKCHPRNTEAILSATKMEEVRIPNSIVKIIKSGKYLY